jgi:hypothetical protein
MEPTKALRRMFIIDDVSFVEKSPHEVLEHAQELIETLIRD